MCPRERFSLYKSLSRLVLCYKKDWATLLHFIYFCYLLLVTNYLITKLSVTTYLVLAENTLLETSYHFLLLLVGFDALTYRKDFLSAGFLEFRISLNFTQSIKQSIKPLIKFKALLEFIFNLELFDFYPNCFSPKIKCMEIRVK